MTAENQGRRQAFGHPKKNFHYFLYVKFVENYIRQVQLSQSHITFKLNCGLFVAQFGNKAIVGI